MNRMEDLDLSREASQAAKRFFKESVRSYETVKFHLALNAWVIGFFSGARHCEKHQSTDARPKWMRWVYFWKGVPTVADYSRDMADGYVLKSFSPMISAEDRALVTSSASTGFRKGFEYRMTEEIFRSEGIRRAKASVPALAPVDGGGCQADHAPPVQAT